MKDGYCENCLNPAECYQSGRCWPVVDYVPDAGKLCAEMDEEAALIEGYMKLHPDAERPIHSEQNVPVHPTP